MKTKSSNEIVFHLAIPTHDLDQAKQFYTEVVGAELARRYDDRITLKFFDHQVVCHLDPEGCDEVVKMYPRHFGITFTDAERFEELYGRSKDFPEVIFKDMFVRFGEKPERHQTFFLKDPSNNLLEFKLYDDPQFVY